MPSVRAALAEAGAEKVTFAQCALGAPVRKYTTVACAPGLREGLGELERAQCTHGTGGHPEVAHGRTAEGAARAARAAAYPRRMNE
eukprot:6174527-Pleurochrysis_carterae.AAC.1